MDVKLERGKLAVDVFELLKALTDEERLELADSLSVMDNVIEYVAQQIVDGLTDAGSYGARGFGDADPRTPLDKAIRFVALGSSEVAKREVVGLSSTLRRRQAHHDQVNDWAWKMWHMINDARRDGCRYPQPPDHPRDYDHTGDAYLVLLNEEQTPAAS